MGSSAWSPLRHKAFRLIWIVGLISNIANWMQNVASTWLMTVWTDSILMVALIQTASGLPSLLLALPAGAVADLIDRRRILLVAQCWMLLVCMALTMVTLLTLREPWVLLGLVFAFSLASAFAMPAQQATTSDVVPPQDVSRAVALSGISYNSARAVGPLLAGGLIAWAGSGLVFAVNLVIFCLAIYLLLQWQGSNRTSTGRAEGILAGMQDGLRYVIHSSVMKRLIWRSSWFVAGASALWALLPVVALKEMGLGSTGYGLMLGALGMGSIVGAGAMPSFRQAVGTNRMLMISALTYAAAMVLVATSPPPVLMAIFLMLAGVAWIVYNASVSAAVHTSVAHWVRGRALALHLFAFNGCMAVGAVLWGTVATYVGTLGALALAGASIGLGLIVLRSDRVVIADGTDLVPTKFVTAPLVSRGGHEDRGGWWLVRGCYKPQPGHQLEFERVLHELGAARLRNGARRWRSIRMDVDGKTVVESFAVPAGVSSQMFLNRTIVGDLKLESELRSLLMEGTTPSFRARYLKLSAAARLTKGK